MSTVDVVHLGDGRVVDLGTHLAGRWGPTRVLELAAGDSHAFGDRTSETCLFVIDGAADLSLDGTDQPVTAGTGLTVVKGTRAVLTATDECRLFVATLSA